LAEWTVDSPLSARSDVKLTKHRCTAADISSDVAKKPENG